MTAVAEANFDAVRVPVTWMDHMDENYQVDEAWMNRVEEVVNYVLSEDMYCILNVHHDCGGSDSAWLQADMEHIEEIQEKFEALWLQIAERFAEYDEKLIFEGYNEMLDASLQWTTPAEEKDYEAINILAQSFVDTVRSTGGNNAQRNLMICPYSADPGEESGSHLVMPTDSAENHLMVDVHVYAPGRFTVNGESFDEAAQLELNDVLAGLEKVYGSKGILVVIGEFGAQDKENDEERAIYANYFLREAALEIFDSSKTMYAEGSPILDPESELAKFIDPANNTATDCKKMLHEAIEAAKNADIVIMALGEHFAQTGEKVPVVRKLGCRRFRCSFLEKS